MTSNTPLRIYCSGPLFSPEEVGAMEAIAEILEKAGMKTFLPHRDGLEPYVMPLTNAPLPDLVPTMRRRVDQAIFDLDMYQLLECCDAVVVNLNGRVPDEGAVVEASVAWACGKPVVFYKHDNRAPFGGYDNAMVTGLTRGIVVTSMRKLPGAVKKARKGSHAGVEVMGELARAVARGGRIWQLIRRLPPMPATPDWSRSALKRVLEMVEVVQGEDED